MSLADELTKLEDLRRAGALTESEFARAKAAVLAGGSAPARDAVADNMAALLAEVRYQNELERIDREWAQEREKYMAIDRYGRRFIPNSTQSLGGAIFVGVFGLLWTVMAFGITSGAPSFGPFAIAQVVFPLFGVAFTAFGVVLGVRGAKKAEEYKLAHAAYLRRRAAVKAGDFR